MYVHARRVLRILIVTSAIPQRYTQETSTSCTSSVSVADNSVVELYGLLTVRCNGWAVILVITGSYIELTSNVHRTRANATTEVTWVDQNAESKQDHRVNQKSCPLAMLARTVILTLSLTPAPSSNTHPPPGDCPSVDGMSQPFGHSFAFLVRSGSSWLCLSFLPKNQSTPKQQRKKEYIY